MLAQRKLRSPLLTPESYAEIDRWLAKYPPERKQSAVMAALTIAQDQNGGWLTSELVNEIADYLQMPPVAVQEVATFYSMYEHKPVGQHKICVCTNISCMLCESEHIVQHLQQTLGIGFGQITPDGKFSLKEVECLGACVNAPMMLIGKTYYENLTTEKVDDILARLN
jgi:NADH-quinone oxidoreductase, E subunit